MLWISLQVSKLTISVSAKRVQTGQWIPMSGKWSLREIQIPVRKVMARKHVYEGCGFESLSNESFFSNEITMKENMIIMLWILS